MHGEFEEMILYHALLIKILLVILVIGMLLPWLGKDCAKRIRRRRIYMFVFHGFLTTVAFSGMVAFVFVQMSFNLSMAFMILAYLLIAFIESKGYLKMLQYQFESERCTTEMRTVALKYGLINIAMVAGLVIWKIVEHKDAIPVS